MTTVDIDLLGGFEIRVGGRPVADGAWVRRAASTLVKLLALAPGRTLHRELVVEALWPGLTLVDAAPRLHQAAHYARKALGDRDAVVLRGETVALLPDAVVRMDVARFDEAAAHALATGDAGDAERALQEYGGELLPQDVYEAWTEPERSRLQQTRLALLRTAQHWDELVAIDPTDEAAHLALMRSYADRGDRRSALRQFERMDRALRTELGLRPGGEAQALRAELLSAGSDVAPPVETTLLVGRHSQQRKLEQLLSEAATGRGSTVLISGGPGNGKSALLSWLRSRATEQRWRCGSGVAAAVEGAWSYAPVLEALADLSRRHPALLDAIDDTYRVEIERALTGEALHWSGDGGHQRLFVAAAELLRVAAAGAGALLTIDDVHDADEASLRLLHYLARNIGSDRVLLVVAHRSGPLREPVEHVRASLLGRAGAVELTVGPLAPSGTAALLSRLVGDDLPETVVEQAHAATGGCPFRVCEVARILRSSPGAGLPGATLLQGIPPDTVAVLRRVAVVGMTFDTDEFVALSGLAEPAAFQHLDAALASGALSRTDSGFRLQHALVRDALLADLPQHRSRELHQAAAYRLEQIGASPARVGHHLVRAGDPSAAAPYLLRAAETAAALGAYRDALELVDSVRTHATGPDRARLLALRADLLLAVGDPAAVAGYREALDQAHGDARRMVRARLARAAALSGDTDTARDALAGFELDGGPADSAILLARGMLAYFTGDLDGADAASEEARSRVTEGTDWQILDLVALQGLIAHNRGEWFLRLRHELRRTRETPSIALAVFDSHLCVAEYLLYGPMPYDEVVQLGSDLRQSAERSGALRAVAFASTLVGEAALLSGDLDSAERELLDAIELHRGISAVAGESHSLQRLAELRLLQGAPMEARRLLRRALTLARWSPVPLHLLHRIYGTMIRAAEDAGEARAVVDTAEAALGTDDFCFFCAVTLAVPAAIACADVGDLDGAERHLRTAESSARLWEGTAWQGAIAEARAHLAVAQGDPALAARMLAAAAESFEDAGQPHDVARCRAAAESVASTGLVNPLPRPRGIAVAPLR